MKKLILGIMLITGSVSFSNESNSDKFDYFEDLKLRDKANYNKEQQSKEEPGKTKQITLSNIFNNNRSAKYE